MLAWPHAELSDEGILYQSVGEVTWCVATVVVRSLLYSPPPPEGAKFNLAGPQAGRVFQPAGLFFLRGRGKFF